MTITAEVLIPDSQRAAFSDPVRVQVFEERVKNLLRITLKQKGMPEGANWTMYSVDDFEKRGMRITGVYEEEEE